MPKLSIDYLNCCIYKIEHIENASLVYVGHTTNFKQRKQRHKSSCNNETDKSKHNRKVYQMIRTNGGWDMFRMIEIEKYPCNSKQEAEKREFEIMKKVNARTNTRILNTHIFLKNEDQKLIQKKKYEEYRSNKQLYNECMRELDFMT
jgi:predicted GIY-YIG superfamily endonuclease